MNLSGRLKQVLLVAGDLVIMVGSLVLALVLRGRDEPFAELAAGAWPWAIVILAWIAVLAFSSLYDIRKLRNDISFLTTFLVAVATNVAVTMAIFYFFPFGIAPKTTLLIFAGVYVVPAIFWRRAFNALIAGSDAAAATLVIGGGETAEELVRVCREHPKHGYRIVAWMQQAPNQVAVAEVPQGIEVVIIPRQATQDPGLAASLYQLLARGVTVRRLDDVYEETFGKVPLSDVDETWLLEHVSRKHGVYAELQDLLTYAAAIFLQLALVPLELLIALAVKLTSRGPVIYSHTRTGRDGKPFTLYKFRSMYRDAERAGPQWSGARDPRITPVGRFIRATHLDELPQIVNILRGELAFVGPRPERPEFEEKLVKEIPHYRVRQLVKPGITGWAQISYRYGASVEDSREKLQYDLHYLRHRSLIMDIFVMLKTVKTFVATPR
jgi:exopolysaccharide biosynthesis polyprenyl glycosylphosphotransferase